MKLAVDNRNLCMAGWGVLALVLLAANLLKLSQLEFQPLTGIPAVVNQLRLHLYRFDDLMSARRADPQSRLDAPIVWTRFSKPDVLPPPSTVAGADEKTTPQRTPLLPQLTGLLQVVHGTGAQHYSAVLDGKVYVEKEQVAGFRIEQISAGGVVLRQRDQRWFLPSPEVHYSIGQKP
jgi:hypothetical protein